MKRVFSLFYQHILKFKLNIEHFHRVIIHQYRTEWQIECKTPLHWSPSTEIDLSFKNFENKTAFDSVT